MNTAQTLPESGLTPPISGECVAFLDDRDTQDTVASVTPRFFDAPLIRQGDHRTALEYLRQAPAPKMLIVDFGNGVTPTAAMLPLTAAFDEQTTLIGIGSVNDVSLYHELLDAGVADYLVKPVTEKALANALSRVLKHRPDADTGASAARRIVVTGARGGVGATTMAVNLAWLLAEERRQHTALVDLDLDFGTVALSLNIEPTRGLREALESPARIDGLFISSSVTKLGQRLSVLATEESANGEIKIGVDAAGSLIKALGQVNDRIVIDLPRAEIRRHHKVLQAADHIVVVCEPTLSSLRDSIRLIDVITEAAPDAGVSVVANRCGGAHQAMRLGDYEKALGRKVDFVVPEDRKAFNEAANVGRPVVEQARHGKAAKVVRGIVEAIEGKPQGAQTGFARLWPWAASKGRD